MSSYGKSVQFEEMTGRENQYGLYVNDRWQVNDKLTVNLGLRYEYYPLMSRADRGLEQLELQHVQRPARRPRRQPEGPRHRGGQGAVRAASRRRLPHQRRHGVPRRLRQHVQPDAVVASDARLLSGDDRLQRCRRRTASFPTARLANGIPGAPNPDIASGNVPLPRGVDMRTPDPDNVKRGSTHSWNMFIERRLPLDLSVSAGYVGTATNDGYADINLNYAEIGRQRQPSVLRPGRQRRPSSTGRRAPKSRYHSLQMAVNRPFKNGLLLKGAYTFSKALNETDDDGWTGVTWNQPSQYDRNYARAGYDRPHMLQMGFVYELPFMRESTEPRGATSSRTGRSTASRRGCRARRSRSAATTACCSRSAARRRSTSWARPSRASARPDPTSSGTTPRCSPARQRLGQHRPQRVPRTVELEPRLLAVPDDPDRSLPQRSSASSRRTCFNHAQWGNPVTGFTDPNFMRIRALRPNPPRTVQLGVRFAF